MTSTNTKLLLASTALVSAITVAGVAQAADLTIATDGAAPTGFTLATDVNSDTNVDAGDVVASTGGALALAAATDSVILSATGVTLTVSETITGATNTNDALIQLTGASNTLNINAALDATTGTATALAHGILVSAASNTINVSAVITEGDDDAAADGINVGSDVNGTVINVLAGGNTGALDFAAVTTATNVVTTNVSHGGTVGVVTANGGSQNVITMTGGTIGAVTTGAVSDTLTLTGSNQATIGALVLGAGNDTVTLSGTDTSATTIASIDGGANADTITVTSGVNTVAGAVDNVETVTVSGGTLNIGGNFGATDLDDLTVSSGAILNVTGTTGVDASATIAGTMGQTDAATVGGNLYVTGAYTGAANLTVTGDTTVSGILYEGGTFGSDDLTVSSAGAVSVTGASTIGGNLNVAGKYTGAANTAVTGNAIVSGTLTEAGTFGAVDLTVNNGGTVSITGAATITDELIVNSGGTANILAASTVATSLTVASGGNLNVSGGVLSGIDNFDVASGANVVVAKTGRINSTNGLANVKNATIEIDGAAGGALTSFGQINITTGSVDFTSEQVGIKIAQGTDLATLDGDTFASIVLGGAAAVSPTAGITGGNAILTYTWTANGNNYDLRTDLKTAGVTTLAGAATGVNNKGLAAVVDSAALASIYESVLLQSDTDTALESLTPDVSGGSVAASINTSVASTGAISNRLALLRGTDNGRSGMVAGDEMMANREMWLQAFGTDVDQDDRDGVAGFQATTGGIAIGVDTDELIDGARVGVAFSYAAADVDSDSANNAQTDIDTYQLSAYASHEMSNGVYVDGMLSYAWNEHDGQRTDFLSNTYESEFDGNQFSLKGEVGKSYDWANTRVTPNFGLHYINVETDDYSETGTGGSALTVNNDDVSALLISLGADVEWNVTGRDGSQYMPYVRAKYSFDAMSEEVETTSSFLAGGTAFKSEGADIEEHSITLGTGINVIATNGFEFTAAYDAEIKEDFLAHTGVLQARWSF
jgi:autotransporter family porin